MIKIILTFLIFRLIPQKFYLWCRKIIRVEYFLLIIPIVLISWGYLSKPSFYYPYNTGVLGDNYFHMAWAMADGYYLKDHHILFPLIPDLVISFLNWLTILDTSDSNFSEIAFLISIYTVMIPALIMVFFFGKIFFSQKKSIFDYILSITFVLTSYAFWSMAIQSNARGLAIAAQFFVFLIFLYAFRKKNLKSTLLLAIALSLCMFLYNGLIYFLIGCYISFLLLMLFDKELSFNKKSIHIIIFHITIICLAWGFYEVESILVNTRDFSKLYNRLADTKYFGEFDIFNIDWKKNFQSNKEYSFVNLANFDWYFNGSIWNPYLLFKLQASNAEIQIRALAVFLIKVLILAGIIDLIFSRKSINFPLFTVALVTSLITLIGFSARQAGTIYYNLAVAPNIALLLSLTITKSRGEYKRLILVIIIFCLLYTNGFGPRHVFRKRKIDEHPVYYETNIIYNNVKTQQAIFIRQIDLDYYPNNSIKTYYKSKFENIRWISDSALFQNKEALYKEIEKYNKEPKYTVYLGPKAAKLLSNKYDYSHITMLADSVWKYNN